MSQGRDIKSLSEQTLIPIGLAIVAIGGGAVWLTELHIQTQANAAQLKELNSKQDKYNEDMHLIREKLFEIEGELKRLRR